MRVRFWGAARTVTGSMHLLEVDGRKLLLECGLYQGSRKQAFERNRDLPFKARDIEAVVLSHAHLDHSGNLPTLVKRGFEGSIYATSATRDLCANLLLDSAKLQSYDLRYVNRRRRRQGKGPLEPLYTSEDVRRTMKRFHAVDYDHSFRPVPGVTVRFRDAGHILGSAIVVVDVEAEGKRLRLLFSGDVGREGLPILRDPQVAENVDYLIMESTYGDRLHDSPGHARRHLLDAVGAAIGRGGKVLVPAFAIGRTQEIVYRLNQLYEDGELPSIPVFVDSPLAVSATEVFRLHPEAYDAEAQRALETEDDSDPLSFPGLQYIRSTERSKQLNDMTGPAVIIAGSGMCEGGRIVHHLRNNIENPATVILLVSFQAEHTLGRRLQEGISPVNILGREFEVRARVTTAPGYSAHADRAELRTWAARVRRAGAVRRVFLVHGEAESALSLAEALREDGFRTVDVPERGQRFDL
jgi:metallo-beta-lactamase family protein